MRRKQAYLLWTAAGAVLGLGAVNAHATPTATLSIDASGGSWTAYLQLDTASDNVGLATMAIDVVPSASSTGLAVTSSNLDLTSGSLDITTYSQVGTTKAKATGGAVETAGFQEFPSSGVNGVAITAGQNLAYGSANSPNLDLEQELGVGQTANPDGTDSGRYGGTYGKVTTNGTSTFSVYSVPSNFAGSITWAVPVDVASGTYTGSGTLNVVLDTTVGQGIQSLNNNGSGGYTGPGNVSFDVVVPGSTFIPGTTTTGPRITLTGTSLVGADDLSGATVTPAADDVNDVITETGGGGTDSYVPIHIHEPGNGVSNGGFQFAGFHQGDNIDVLLKFSNLTTGTDPVPGNSALLSDIENYINANDGTTGITVSTVPAALAADFPGTTYDLLLSLPSPTTDPFADFDFSAFGDSSVPTGDLGLSDIGVVPEPASLGLLMLGGIGLVGRRRKKDSK